MTTDESTRVIYCQHCGRPGAQSAGQFREHFGKGIDCAIYYDGWRALYRVKTGITPPPFTLARGWSPDEAMPHELRPELVGAVDGCRCYVATLPTLTQFTLHYGAHDDGCPRYRASLDPVDRAHDEEFRAAHNPRR